MSAGVQHRLHLNSRGHISGLVAEPAGHFILWPGFEVSCYRRPNWLHRIAMRAMFGWRWRSHARVNA